MKISLEVIVQELLELKQLVLDVKKKQEILSTKREVHSEILFSGRTDVVHNV
jgi:hypothetical protein